MIGTHAGRQNSVVSRGEVAEVLAELGLTTLLFEIDMKTDPRCADAAFNAILFELWLRRCRPDLVAEHLRVPVPGLWECAEGSEEEAGKEGSCCTVS